MRDLYLIFIKAIPILGTYGENNNSNNNNVVDEEEKIVWRSYKLVRAPDGNELERLMEGQLPLLKRTLNIVH